MNDEQNRTLNAFDELLAPNGPVALAGKQLLKLASFDDEKTEIAFPPSYANPSEKKDDPPVYNIDPPYDAHDPLTHNNVCVLDSIPSQANRMEPLFKEGRYRALVPQYALDFGDGKEPTSILEIGHRIADAAFRGTPLRNEKIVPAFRSYSRNDASGLARLAPTSLIFGVWDSRGTGVKVPRLINSIIRAFNVRPLKRSAQYTPPIKYEVEGQLPLGLEGKPADHGLADVPSTHKIGGVQVFGDIRRDLSLNIELLRDMHAPLSEDNRKKLENEYDIQNPKQSEKDRTKGVEEAVTKGQREADLKLQRYILGLALLAFTAPQKTHLRQGCQLLPKGKTEWMRFNADGDESPWTPSAEIGDFANAAAEAFGAALSDNHVLKFNKDLLKASIDADAKRKADKKADNAGDPIARLKTLVDELEPVRGDKFSTVKTAKLAKLQAAVAGIEADSAADTDLRSLAAKLKPLLTADTGAGARKGEMVALFSDAGGGETDETPHRPTEDAR